MTTASVRPEQVLAEDENTTTINGVAIRKGTIAAFLRNIELLESSALANPEVLQTLKELAPAVIAAGLYHHVTFKNPAIQSLLDEEYSQQKAPKIG